MDGWKYLILAEPQSLTVIESFNAIKSQKSQLSTTLTFCYLLQQVQLKPLRTKCSPIIFNGSLSQACLTSLPQSTLLGYGNHKIVWQCGMSRLIKSYSGSTSVMSSKSRECSQPTASLCIHTPRELSFSLSKTCRQSNSLFMTYARLQIESWILLESLLLMSLIPTCSSQLLIEN